MNEPIIGDETRQAVGPMRGYHYQLLRSIYEWLELAPEDRLFLEGAEDFDRVTNSGAQATQVKYTETDTRVTLRSPGAVAAINNFWAMRTKNPGRAVHLAFLTTAKTGVEAGDPFCNGSAGLDLWNIASRGTQDATALAAAEAVRRFLVEDARLDEVMLKFLSAASPSDAKAQLFDNVIWLTNQPLVGDVEEAILRKLAAICWD